MYYYYYWDCNVSEVGQKSVHLLMVLVVHCTSLKHVNDWCLNSFGVQTAVSHINVILANRVHWTPMCFRENAKCTLGSIMANILEYLASYDSCSNPRTLVWAPLSHFLVCPLWLIPHFIKLSAGYPCLYGVGINFGLHPSKGTCKACPLSQWTL